MTESESSCLIAFAGELDAVSAATAKQIVLDALASDARVVIDLRELEFIDSSGLGVLILALRSPGADQLSFHRSEAPAVQRLLEVTGIGERLRYEPAPE